MTATLRSRLSARRHTALLVAIVFFFAIRPVIGDVGVAPVFFSAALLLLLVVALYTMEVDELVGERHVLLAQRRRRRIIGVTFALVAVGERVAMLIHPTPTLDLLGAVGWFLFFAFVTWIQLHGTLRQKSVTDETISMAISVYLLMGLTWGVGYVIIYQLQPDAFAFPAAETTSPTWATEQHHLFPAFFYFSLTTLSTVGHGDITPITLQARYAAVAEGITGQLYLAILVARLVGMQMASRQR